MVSPRRPSPYYGSADGKTSISNLHPRMKLDYQTPEIGPGWNPIIVTTLAHSSLEFTFSLFRNFLTYYGLIRHGNVYNTCQESAVTSIIGVKKTTSWGESGFQARLLAHHQRGFQPWSACSIKNFPKTKDAGKACCEEAHAHPETQTGLPYRRQSHHADRHQPVSDHAGC